MTHDASCLHLISNIVVTAFVVMLVMIGIAVARDWSKTNHEE